MDLNRVISRVTIVISPIRRFRLITLLITTHEPPSIPVKTS